MSEARFMVDRVAEAIARIAVTQKVPDFHTQAVAAMKAMREPTDEMKTCSDEVHWGYGCHTCGGLKEGWQMMIDAALGKVDA